MNLSIFFFESVNLISFASFTRNFHDGKNVKCRILDKWTGIHCLSCQQTLAELASVRISNTGTTKVSKCEKGRGAEGDRADIDSLLHMGGETKQR